MTLNPLPGRLPKKKNELFNSMRKLQVRLFSPVVGCFVRGGVAERKPVFASFVLNVYQYTFSASVSDFFLAPCV